MALTYLAQNKFFVVASNDQNDSFAGLFYGFLGVSFSVGLLFVAFSFCICNQNNVPKKSKDKISYCPSSTEDLRRSTISIG